MDSRVSRRRPNPKMSPSRVSRRDPYLPEVGLWWSKSRRLMRGGTFFAVSTASLKFRMLSLLSAFRFAIFETENQSRSGSARSGNISDCLPDRGENGSVAAMSRRRVE